MGRMVPPSVDSGLEASDNIAHMSTYSSKVNIDLVFWLLNVMLYVLSSQGKMITTKNFYMKNHNG